MRNTLLVATAILGLGTAANASVIPVLDSITPDGTEFIYSYSGTLSGDQGLTDGSHLVIFDFAGYVDGSIDAGAFAADVATSVEFTSDLAPPLGQVDDPLLLNLVFTWIGADFNTSGGPFADTDFDGLSARSIFGDPLLGAFSNVAVTNNGVAEGELAFNSGRVGVPAPGVIPEPTTWALLIMGFGGAGAMLRTRRRLTATA